MKKISVGELFMSFLVKFKEKSLINSKWRWNAMGLRKEENVWKFSWWIKDGIVYHTVVGLPDPTEFLFEVNIPAISMKPVSLT